MHLREKEKVVGFSSTYGGENEKKQQARIGRSRGKSKLRKTGWRRTLHRFRESKGRSQKKVDKGGIVAGGKRRRGGWANRINSHYWEYTIQKKAGGEKEGRESTPYYKESWGKKKEKKKQSRGQICTGGTTDIGKENVDGNRRQN